jgi:hypothetical protein
MEQWRGSFDQGSANPVAFKERSDPEGNTSNLRDPSSLLRRYVLQQNGRIDHDFRLDAKQQLSPFPPRRFGRI